MTQEFYGRTNTRGSRLYNRRAFLKEALKNTVPRPVSPVYSDMSLKMSEEFDASLGGDTQPQQAISSLQSELQKIADQAPS